MQAGTKAWWPPWISAPHNFFLIQSGQNPDREEEKLFTGLPQTCNKVVDGNLNASMKGKLVDSIPKRSSRYTNLNCRI